MANKIFGIPGCKGKLIMRAAFADALEDAINIEVDDWEFDPEIDTKRIRTTGNGCVKKTIQTGKASGQLKIKGFFDIESPVYDLTHNLNGVYPAFFWLQFFPDVASDINYLYYLDDDSEASAELPGAQISSFIYTGTTDDQGMQKFAITIDAQYGSLWEKN